MKAFKSYRLSFLLMMLFASAFPSGMQAQDIHFTQFQASTIQLNPAMTGLYNGTIRVSAIARNQWATLPVNYNSAKFSVEYKFLSLRNKDRLSAGMMFYYDRAGDSRYSTAYPGLSLSYAKSLNRKGNQFISIGANCAMISRQIDYSLLQFDAQYNGEFYDANANSNENTGKISKNVFDVGAGIAYSFNFKKKYALQTGFAIQHLNRPNYSFKGNKDVKLNSRYTAHLSADMAMTDNFSVLPQILYQRQDTKSEFLFAILLKNKILPLKKKDISFYYGPSYRLHDAVSIIAGTTWNQWNVGISYDINMSPLRVASNTYGAVELSVQYIYSHLIKYKDSKQICPIF